MLLVAQVDDLDVIAIVLQKGSGCTEQLARRVGENHVTVHLHDLVGHETVGLTGARSGHNEHVAVRHLALAPDRVFLVVDDGCAGNFAVEREDDIVVLDRFTPFGNRPFGSRLVVRVQQTLLDGRETLGSILLCRRDVLSRRFMLKENGKGDYEGCDDRGQQRDPAEIDTEGPTGCRPRDERHDVIGRLDTACSEHDLLDREVHDPEGGRSQHDGSDSLRYVYPWRLHRLPLDPLVEGSGMRGRTVLVSDLVTVGLAVGRVANIDGADDLMRAHLLGSSLALLESD